MGHLDVNGWDLAKALKLMLKGNAVVLEWLRSPFVYGADPVFRDELLAFAQAQSDPVALARHYLHLGENQRRTYFADEQAIALKKLFYALRPAAALRWLRLRGDGVPPMHFPMLMAECDAPSEVREVSDRLLAAKAATRELGVAPLPPVLGRFIDEEFSQARQRWREAPMRSPDRSTAERFFRAVVLRFDPEPG